MPRVKKPPEVAPAAPLADTPEVAPAAPLADTPEVATAAPLADTPEVATAAPQESLPETQGPSIEYIGEGAEQVKYTPSPAVMAAKVYADGQVVETY